MPRSSRGISTWGKFVAPIDEYATGASTRVGLPQSCRCPSIDRLCSHSRKFTSDTFRNLRHGRGWSKLLRCSVLIDISAFVQDCAPPQYAALMRRIVGVESSGNPYSIGVVRARLARQPVNLSEAVATAKSLRASKYNFSIGLAQVNQVHFSRLGWTNQLAEGFDACKNISAGAEILDNCFAKATQFESQSDNNEHRPSVSRMALSCYYSGDLFLGERLGYVTKVIGHSPTANIHQSPKPTTMDYSYEDK